MVGRSDTVVGRTRWSVGHLWWTPAFQTHEPFECMHSSARVDGACVCVCASRVCRVVVRFLSFVFAVRWCVTGADDDDDDDDGGVRRAPSSSSSWHRRRGGGRASNGDGATRSRRDGERAGDGERGDARGGVAWGVCVV